MSAARSRTLRGRPAGGQFASRGRAAATVDLEVYTEQPTVELDPDEPAYSKPPRRPGQECLNSGRPVAWDKEKGIVRIPGNGNVLSGATRCWKCGAENVVVERVWTASFSGYRTWNYRLHAVPAA